MPSPFKQFKTPKAARLAREVTTKPGGNVLPDYAPEEVLVPGLTPTMIEEGVNGGAKAFKLHIDHVSDRQEKQANSLMMLGGMKDPSPRQGKFMDKTNLNLKPSAAANLYYVDPDVMEVMRHKRSMDEYPEYAPDGSFRRAYEDPKMVSKKAVERGAASLVHQASAVKLKNSADYIQQILQSESYTEGKNKM